MCLNVTPVCGSHTFAMFYAHATQTITDNSQSPVVDEAKSQLVCLKGKLGTIVATGEVVAGNIIHGDQVGDENLKVLIKEVLQRDATSWFPDKFGEEMLCKGTFVAWPKHNVTVSDNNSPMLTRTRSKTLH